ncbi:MAG: CRISPR system precrRNA processing endoribonuclease RAMP protein Cas6 [Caldilinea sp.]|nr:CRISPR system precrRNA processing endoribonuclease RAMP protein Cas6 [Caldilinea sp.]MCB0052728.1 CRISPR system precrRNA processing endoribonuclease RAMP protein Cas6 [Caldilinea sp.]MCB0149022.1 CRISPR system precrRNA processing endoribonuclease RAMP protein Cas6 [Caldilineaceae bacterium]MCW5844726.1 CRISPR system precrRNA processing endoribonuclease RAMP protein Cas6 [Caldilinea sp.]
MLISLIVKLTADRDALFREHLGRACYAETLRTMERRDADLVHALHDRKGPKPVTCSGLIGGTAIEEGVQVLKGEPCAIRITGLNEPATACLLGTFGHAPPAAMTFAGVRFTVTGVVCDADQHAWTGQTTYAVLASHLYSTRAAATHLTLEFASPTSFRSNNKNMPLPLPNLVFGSLVDRWNTFSSTVFNEEFRQFAEQMVAISRFSLDSHAVRQKNDALHMGCTGNVTYAVLGGSQYWRTALEILADFSLYSGVGVKTAAGMGQVRRSMGEIGERSGQRSPSRIAVQPLSP